MGHYDCKECDASPHEAHSLDCSKAPKDWSDQLDGCDVCEVCGQLTKGGRLWARVSLAVTLLYTHGAMTATERDAVRNRITRLTKQQPAP